MAKLSYSTLSKWVRCRYNYHIEDELGIETRRERPAIAVGTAGHAGLAAALRKKKQKDGYAAVWPAIKAWEEETKTRAGPDWGEALKMEIEETASFAYELVVRALGWLDIGHRFETVYLGKPRKPAVEMRIEVPLPGWEAFTGALDWVAMEIDTRQMFLVDHKFRESFRSAEEEDYNAQMAVYQHLVSQQYRIHLAGSISHQIKRKPFTIPERLKPRKKDDVPGMSQAQIFTTWEEYRRHLVAANLDPANYTGMEEKLAGVELYRMSRAYRTPHEVAEIWNNFVLPASQEMARSSKVANFRSISAANCSGCRVKDLCFEQLRGRDTTYLMNTMYRVRGDDHRWELPTFEDEETVV